MNGATAVMIAALVAGTLGACQPSGADSGGAESNGGESGAVPGNDGTHNAVDVPIVQPAVALESLARIDLGARGTAVAASQAGDVVTFAADGTMRWLRIQESAGEGSEGVIDVAEGRFGGEVAFASFHRGAVYAVDRAGGSLWRIVLNGTELERHAIDIGPELAGFWIDQEHDTAWVVTRGFTDTPVAVVQLAPIGEPRVGEIVHRFTAGPFPVSLSASRNRASLALPLMRDGTVHIFDVYPPGPSSVIATGDAPIEALVLADGRVLVRARTRSEILVFDRHNAEPVPVQVDAEATAEPAAEPELVSPHTSIALEWIPTFWTLSPDESTLFVAAGGAGTISRIDMRTLETTASTDAYRLATWLQVEDNRLWVTEASGQLAVLDALTLEPLAQTLVSGAPDRAVMLRAVSGDSPVRGRNVAVVLNPGEFTVDVLRLAPPNPLSPDPPVDQLSPDPPVDQLPADPPVDQPPAQTP